MAGHSDDALSSLSWLVGLNSASCLTQLDADNAPGRRCRQGSWKKAPAPNRAAPYTASLPQYWATGGDDTHTAQGDELPAERPSLSFTCLIGLAILRSKGQKAAVGSIYQFIHANFPYFRKAKATWRNSIRHVLSLGKFFFKVRGGGGGGGAGQAGKKAARPGNMWCINAGAHATLLKLIEQGQKDLSPKFVRHLSLHNLQSIRLKVHQPPPACKSETPGAALPDLARLPAFGAASSAAPRVPDCVHDLDLEASMDSLLDLGCHAHLVDCASSSHDATQGLELAPEGCYLANLESLGYIGYSGGGVAEHDQGYDSHDSDCDVMSLTSSTASTMSTMSTYSDCSDYSGVGIDVCAMPFCDQVQWPAADDATVPASWSL